MEPNKKNTEPIEITEFVPELQNLEPEVREVAEGELRQTESDLEYVQAQEPKKLNAQEMDSGLGPSSAYE